LAGLPLLVLEIFPVVYGQESAKLFLAPALAFLLLLADNRDRLVPRIGAVVLSVSMVVPALIPQISGVYESHKGIGMPEKAKTITTLDPLVSMRGDLVQPTDTDLITVRTDSAHPGDLYLRAVTLDYFDGVQWKAGKRTVSTFEPQLPAPPGLSPAISTSAVDSQINAMSNLQSDYLPLPYPATQVMVGGQWRLDQLTQNIVSHDGRKQISGLPYTVQSLDLNASASDVGSAVLMNSYLTPYLQTPANLPAAIKHQAQQVTGGATSPYEIGVALQSWFTAPGNFTYDLRTPPGTGQPAISDFLQFRRGFCEQFAATMAVMARLLGVPARVDVGFTSGRLATDGLTRIISAHDAHAWPELWLPNIGWTRFEPTPGNAASNPHAPNWLIAKQPQNPKPLTGSSPAPSQPESGSGGGAPQPLGANQYDCAAAPDAPQCQSSNGPQSPDQPNHHHHSAAFPTLIWLVPLLALLGGPALIREFRRRRRWALIAAVRLPGSQAAVAAEAAWRELRDTTLDLGFPWPVARTPRQTAAQLAADGELTPVGTVALVHISGTVERTRYARAATADPDQLRGAVIRVQHELREKAGWPRRIRALVAPPSLWLSLRTAVERPIERPRRPRAMRPRRASN
jgi:transglutaminase-like putative cysteine protease